MGGERTETKRTPSLSNRQLQPSGTSKKISLRGSEGLRFSGSTPFKARSGTGAPTAGESSPGRFLCSQGCREPKTAQWSSQGQTGNPPHRRAQPLTRLDTQRQAEPSSHWSKGRSPGLDLGEHYRLRKWTLGYLLARGQTPVPDSCRVPSFYPQVSEESAAGLGAGAAAAPTRTCGPTCFATNRQGR